MSGTRIPWSFFNSRTSATFTSDVMSASMNTGRQTYMDVYNGGSLVFTIDNRANQAAAFAMNDQIILNSGSSFSQYFWLDEIQYSDYQGNTGMSTATIVCSDAIARFGRGLQNNKVLTQTFAGDQMIEVANLGGTALLPQFEFFASYSNLGSTVSGITYTGAAMQRMNQLQSTDRGLFRQLGATLYYYTRSAVGDMPVAGVTIGRTDSSTQIAYQDFSRINLGLNFMNNVTVTPTGGAEQVAQNTASVAAYGSNFYSVQSEDATNAQALSLAEWLANSQSDPTALRFEIGFTDRAQNFTALDEFLDVFGFFSSFLLNYLVPGAGSETQTRVVMEGFSIDITPSESRFRVYFSPLTYYQFFTLNSATNGVLDTSRLGW
jgi:hypothetical protein